MGYDKYKSLLSYRYGQLKKNGLWNIALRTVRYTRRYFLISRLIRFVSYIIAAIETSAVLLVVLSALLVLLPVIIIIFGIIVIFSTTKYKKYSNLISEDTNNRKIVVIDAKKGYFGRSAYLNNMAKCFKNEGYTVLVISRSFRNDRFLVTKKAENNIWVLKLNFFFILKKKLNNDDIIYIY